MQYLVSYLENINKDMMRRESTFLEEFTPYFERIDEEIGKVLKSDISLIEEVAQYSLLGNGKRVRPLFFIFSCELCNYTDHDRYTLSTIFECLHAANLLHYDVVDNGRFCRGSASVNKLWGNPAAILVGDFLFSKFSQIGIERKHIELLKILTDTAMRMTEGQVLELVNTHNWNLTRKEYMDIITAKTAALISAACGGGGIVAGADEKDIQSLKNFGLNMGIAFQIIDDVFDYDNALKDTRKLIGSDLRDGKITLPLIYALACLPQQERERLENLFKNGDAIEHDYKHVTELVQAKGAIARCRYDAQKHIDRAARYLNLFSESPIKECILKLNRFVLTGSS